MKSRDDLLKLVAAILVATPPGEFPTGGTPSGELYVALMAQNDVSLELYNSLISSMQTSGSIKVRGHYITLTDAGEKLRGRIVAALEGSKS